MPAPRTKFLKQLLIIIIIQTTYNHKTINHNSIKLFIGIVNCFYGNVKTSLRIVKTSFGIIDNSFGIINTSFGLIDSSLCLLYTSPSPRDS